MSATLTQRLRPEWIDYNGHLSEAYYVLVFGFATDALMDRVGLDAAYRERSGRSLYTVEAHVRYLREVAADDEDSARAPPPCTAS
uniref:thioesterase family protein n=1 Tax=Nocardiopsis sp. TNDT3 TaxID=2249354 RepID=UPI0018E587F0